jgi:subtilase family serine protease
MTIEQTEMISAQVVLKSASGSSLSSAPITAENLEQFIPAPSTVELAQKFFRERGFQVSGMVGISFSISGFVSTFESFFDVHLRRKDDKSIQAVTVDGNTSYELPVDMLPSTLGVVAVTFTPPPDFGPTEFH